MDNQHVPRGGYEGRGHGGRGFSRGEHRGGSGDGQRRPYNNQGGRGGPREGYRGGQQNYRGYSPRGHPAEEGRRHGRSYDNDGGERRGGGIQARLSRSGSQMSNASGESSQDQPRYQARGRGDPYRGREVPPPNSYSQSSVPQVTGGFGVPPPEERESSVYMDPIGVSKSFREGLQRHNQPYDRYHQRQNFYNQQPSQFAQPKTSKLRWKKNWPKADRSQPLDKFMQEELKKIKKYPKGMNEPERSDYELDPAIPVFDEEQGARDAKICTDLFEVIRAGSPTTSAEIFLRYKEAVAEKEESVLESPEELEKFLREHPHVFEVDDIDGTVSNQGFGYRRGMVYLACIIHAHETDDPQGASLLDLFDEIASFPTYDPQAAWMDDYLWRVPLVAAEQLLEFLQLKQNEVFFNLNTVIHSTDPNNPSASVYIRINDKAKKIPTLWDSTLLLVDDLDKTTSWWDQSRLYNLLGSITVSQADFAQACISHGPFAGRRVFIVPADVGQGTTNLSCVYQAGNEVEIRAFQTLFTKNNVTATYLKLADFNRRPTTTEGRRFEELDMMAGLMEEFWEEEKQKTINWRSEEIGDSCSSSSEDEEDAKIESVKQAVEEEEEEKMPSLPASSTENSVTDPLEALEISDGVSDDENEDDEDDEDEDEYD